MRTFRDVLREYEGQPIAVLCMRYWYRGILREVGEGFIVLDPAHMVTITGLFTASQTQTEDIIPGQIVLKTDVIEIVAEPTWVASGLDAETPCTGRANNAGQ